MPHPATAFSRRLLSGLLLSAVALAALPALSFAQELIPPRNIDRKFPQFVFCGLPVDIAFVANGPTARIEFEGDVYAPTSNPPFIQWANQAIDNVSVSSDADFTAHFGGPPSGVPWEFCYQGDPVPVSYFYFNDATGLPLLEQFDDDPAARGWDVTQGAVFEADRTAVRDPEPSGTHNDFSGGCLQIGQEVPSPTGNETGKTSITVSGLTAGVTYHVGAWWSVVNFEDEESVRLTIRVFGDDTTPLSERSWGSIKARYR
jgi:hypothetical protein